MLKNGYKQEQARQKILLDNYKRKQENYKL